jgi:two-component system chemotaxis response regulator CheY
LKKALSSKHSWMRHERTDDVRILIADDVEMNRMLLETMLGSLGEVTMVENGVEAVQAAEEALMQEDPYDLICLDVQMPVMDGLEALHTFRASESRHGARRSVIFMVTASSDPEHMLQALENEGCDDFIVKPVMKKALLSLVQKHGLLA